MANATAAKPSVVENIHVFQVGKFGVRINEKDWYNTNEPLTPTQFEEGKGYKVGLSVSKTGKKYINEILGVEETKAPAAAAPTTEKVAETPKSSPAPAKTDVKTPQDVAIRAGYGQPLTQYDLAKDRQISRAGLYQAALSSPALAQWAVNVDEYLALVRKVADAGVQYVGE